MNKNIGREQQPNPETEIKPNNKNKKCIEREKELIKRNSRSMSTSSSNCDCSTNSSQSNVSLHKRSKRKRKLSRKDSTHSFKKIKLDDKQSFRGRRSSLEKKIKRRYSLESYKNRNYRRKNEGKIYKEEEYIKKLNYLSRYGKNFYCPSLKERKGLRPIYIDGSNVAFSHGQNERFSVKGLRICIDYFRKRGHEVKAFVPNFRLRKGESTDQKLLHKLVKKKLVIVTPTLYIQNQRRSPYDDWYIVQSAAANGGIIVSADNFQDIIRWNPNLRTVVEERRLVPTFVDDMLIFPVDPHGNRQNNLEQFLIF